MHTIDDNNFEKLVQQADDSWIIFFGATWSPESEERRAWFQELVGKWDCDTKIAYAEVNTASIPGHFCGIICVPSIVLWRPSKVIDQLIEFFDRSILEKKLEEWRS